MESQKEVERQLYQFQYIKQQRDMFQNQLELMSASLNNMRNTKFTLENIKEGVKLNDEILVPIGGIINVKATIKDTQKVLLYISQDVVVEKSVDGAIEYLDKTIEEHNKQIEFLGKQLQNLDANLQGLSQNLQQYLPQR